MESKRPNILLLFADQQRFDTISAAGYGHMRTPNLDRLVAEGRLFTNAYTPNPVCVPARHSLLTGVTEAQHGITSNNYSELAVDGLATLPRALSDADYFTAAVGKMHFDPCRRHHGFLEMHVMEELVRHRSDDAYATWLESEGLGDLRVLHGVRSLLYHEPQHALVDAEHHGTQWVARKAIEVIEQNAGRRPFYLHCGWIKPHPPWDIPDEWWGHYDGIELPSPIPGPRIEPDPTQHSAWFGDDDDSEMVRRIRAAYYTSISMVDHAVGRIIDHLESTGVLDDTLIIFTSDHGEMLGDHGRYQKMKPYESSAHIPFVVRWPKAFKGGTTEDRFVDLLDIMPTALDAAGVQPESIYCGRPYNPAGSSLLRLGEGRDRSIQRSAYGYPGIEWVMLRDSRYKYVHYADGGIEWFFDLQHDPRELHNLIGSDELPADEYERLRQRCVEEERRLGLPGMVMNGELFSRKRVDSGEPVLTGKLPWWANDQMPMLNELSDDEEVELHVSQIESVLARSGGGIEQLNAPRLWFEHFLDCLRERGVGEKKVAEIATRLGIS